MSATSERPATVAGDAGIERKSGTCPRWVDPLVALLLWRSKHLAATGSVDKQHSQPGLLFVVQGGCDGAS